LLCRECHDCLHDLFNLIFKSRNKSEKKLVILTFGFLEDWGLEKFLDEIRNFTGAKLRFDWDYNYVFICSECAEEIEAPTENKIKNHYDKREHNKVAKGPAIRKFRKDQIVLNSFFHLSL